ncbi:MAG: helix-turn-helix domain-containing protein [Saprospiraceae bacterium]
MHTVRHIPAVPLAHFVALIWISEAGRFDYANLTLPMLHHELVINFSDHFAVHTQREKLINNDTAWLAGLQTQPIQTTTGGKHFTVGVLFKPWGLQALTGIDAIELQNQAIDLESIFGAAATQLVAQIYEQPDPQHIIPILERFLLQHWQGRQIPAYVSAGLEQLQQVTLQDGIVQQIAHQLGISEKTFIQAFRKYIGVTPGKLHHLFILQRLLLHLVNNPGQSLTESGYALDFFDQAHFIRFFKQYTGFTPSAYVRAYQAGKIVAAAPYSIELVP